ncbi:MAG: sodium:proton antiporter [Holosporaceae bacterium]|nr:MAG: sodium:proton antiporter [Holosporaceae bacterium]
MKWGAFGSIISRVNSNGIPNNLMYFLDNRAFSSFLDNAPLYLIFFHMAEGCACPYLIFKSNTYGYFNGRCLYGAMTYIETLLTLWFDLLRSNNV